MADISSIKLPDGNSYDIKDPSKVAKSGDTMSGTLKLAANKYYDQNSVSGLDANNSDIIGVNGLYFQDASDNGSEGINFYRDATHWDSLYAWQGRVYISPNRPKGSATGDDGSIELYGRPFFSRETTDIAMRSMVDFSRANRLAFLPPSQVIIEKTTDGGVTWESAGYSDDQKKLLFGTRGANIQIPLLNGAKSLNCGVRVTFTAMRYNVPEGTAETNKYSYWNSSYVASCERYSNLRELWFWVSANNDTIQPKVYAATGSNPNNWVTYFDKDFRMTGWSGSDWVRWSGGPTFGGGTTQTTNYWNWRIEFWSRYADNKTAFNSAAVQSIAGILGFGDNVWTMPNGMMKDGHLYTYDANQNATFPAKVTATSFSGPLTGDVTGNATTATNAPTQTSISSTGLVTFKNGSGTNLFTLQLPQSINVQTSTSKAYILGTTTTPTSSAQAVTAVADTSIYSQGSVLYGAAWNDYAEYREADALPGDCVVEVGDGTLRLSSVRLEPGASIVSDTYGFAIGQTLLCGCPIAVSGRVLARTYKKRDKYKAGDAVCAAPGGTVDIMTREEIREYPDRIVGIVSEIPNYKTWGQNPVQVNDRIWIKVK